MDLGQYSGTAGTPGAPGSGFNGLGAASSAMGIMSGLSRGGLMGDAGAALSAGSLYNNFAGPSNAIPGVGPAGQVLGIYNGLRQGGLMGYGTAALDGTALASGLASSGALGASAAGSSLAGMASMLGPIGAIAGMVPMFMQGLSSHNVQLSPQYYRNANNLIKNSLPTKSSSNPNGYIDPTGSFTPAEAQQWLNLQAGLSAYDNPNQTGTNMAELQQQMAQFLNPNTVSGFTASGGARHTTV